MQKRYEAWLISRRRDCLPSENFYLEERQPLYAGCRAHYAAVDTVRAEVLWIHTPNLTMARAIAYQRRASTRDACVCRARNRTLLPSMIRLTAFVAGCCLMCCCAPNGLRLAQPGPDTASVHVLSIAAVPVESTPPMDWHLQDRMQSGVVGTSWIRAEQELLLSLKPRRAVVVAIIDDGIDSTVRDIRALLWKNPSELAGNHVDDDGNGFIDDVFGWNFIGGASGVDVADDTFEVTRLARHCTAVAENVRRSIAAECSQILEDFALRRTQNLRRLSAAVANQQELLKLYVQLGDTAETQHTVTSIHERQPRSDTARRAQRTLLDLAAEGVTMSAVVRARARYEAFVKFGYNPEFDPRPLVGDDYPDTVQRIYGNDHALLARHSHGSSMAKLIAGLRRAPTGGLLHNVSLMSLRVVPNGDERDKDVALAIRYAVAHGARIINMSFGKPYSSDKEFVDQEVRRGVAAGVLFVHAAGNDGRDISMAPNFPTARYADGTQAPSWIEVGASGWHDGHDIAANFSNYSKSMVDVFAPGVDMGIIGEDNEGRQDGTSASAAVVSGIAALLFSYFPQLTASEIRSIILDSASRFPNRIVEKPGGRMVEIAFKELSSSGGIVNAYAAVREALRRTRRP